MADYQEVITVLGTRLTIEPLKVYDFLDEDKKLKKISKYEWVLYFFSWSISSLRGRSTVKGNLFHNRYPRLVLLEQIHNHTQNQEITGSNL